MNRRLSHIHKLRNTMTPTQLPVNNRVRWTVEEFERLTELGAFDGRRLELLDGEITEKMSQNEPHASGVLLMQYKLLELFGRGFLVRVQLPMALQDSKPEPDACVTEGVPQGLIPMPSTALLVVEISDTTLQTDRNVKSHIYARAGILDYWIIDVNARQIEVRRDPRADPTQPLGYTYGSLQTLGGGGSIAPLSRPDAAFPVADVLP